MNITVLIVGLLVLCLFALPFYFVAHAKSKTPPAKEFMNPNAQPIIKHPGRKKKKHTKH